MTLSAWDRRLASRAAGIAIVAALVGLLVIVTTDDGATWARRAAMWGAIAPVAGAVGTLGALRLAASRGELVALEAIGVRPSRSRLGAVLGGVALALVGPCVAGSPYADRSALFPAPVEGRVWAPEGAPRRASIRELTMGVRVEPGGRITFLSESEGRSGLDPRVSSGRRAADAGAIASIALCAIACPAFVAGRSSAMRMALVGLAAILALIAAFQAVALDRGSPLLLLGAPLLLLADALVARYRARPRA